MKTEAVLKGRLIFPRRRNETILMSVLIQKTEKPIRNAPSAEIRAEMIEVVAKTCDVRAERDRRFAEMTSLRVGGTIEWTLFPKQEAAAACAVYELDKAHIRWRVLGAGSNILATDETHGYVVVNTREMKNEMRVEGNRVSVSAGYSLPRLCLEAARQGLAGIEGLGGIPGTVGGALWMNAGAYNQEIGNVVESVRLARQGKVVEIAGGEIEWEYRKTSFTRRDFILGATLLLRPDEATLIEARVAEAKRKRLSTQPHKGRSAGCFFKNLPDGRSTGKMIDDLGYKGMQRGGASVSEVHANFIVTDGETATADDALSLAEEIRTRINREHNVELEYEVEIWRGDGVAVDGRDEG